ncbi:MAG: flavodoxin family protein [Gammaproteobacteria bacterium]|nr:flavodoxin family protein [Gammaproteobacteria bacterium]
MTNHSSKILVINGSYRVDGITDQAVDVAIKTLEELGSEVESVFLREYKIEFCFNCRECTQQPGDMPRECVQHDGMQKLIEKIEQADGYILASPTNFGSVTAIFKRFMERLIVYAYWPWENNFPEFRKANTPRKKALLISSSAAPGIFGRWRYSTISQLKTAAQTIGADSSGTLFTGLIGRDPGPQLPRKVEAKARILAAKLLNP